MEHQTEPRRRWDPVVKLTHWGVVLAVIANALVTEEGSGWHIWVGYGLAALLAVRVLWGVVGPAEARFSAFPPSPRKAVAHLGEIRRGEVVRHRSHNPLGALMAYAIWVTLLVVIGTGIAMAGPPPADPSTVRENGRQGEGMALSSVSLVDLVAPPARADEDEREEEGDEASEGGEEIFEEVHELAVNLLYGLIALHLMGVILETRRTGREIVGAMIPGGSRLT